MLHTAKNSWIAGSLVFLAILCLASSGWAQPYLFFGPLSDFPQFGVRFIHPQLSEDYDLKTWTGTYDFSFALPLSPSLDLVGAVPFVKVAIKDQDSSSFGNIYVGLQTRQPEDDSRLTSVGFGVFLPTATRDDESTLQFGAVTNYHDVAKYIPEYLTLVMTPSFKQRIGTSGVFGLDLGPQILIPTGGDDDELEIFLQYGATAGMQTSTLSLLAELIGLYMMTIDDVSSGDRFVNSFQVRAWVQLGMFRPTLFYRVPLDENQKEFLDSSIGVQLELTFR